MGKSLRKASAAKGYVTINSLTPILKIKEEGVASYLYLCFTCNLEYPKGSGILCTILQRWVAKLDEHGTMSTTSRKDKLDKSDKGKTFSSAFNAYCRV